jgi:hypothetical protein
MPKATSTTIAWVLSIIASSGILVKGQSELGSMVYNCSLPGLEDFTPGQYRGVTANYLSYFTDRSSPNFPVRAAEF